MDDTHLPTYAKPARGNEYRLFSPPNDREKVIANLLCVFIALTIAVALKCIQVYLSKISRYAVIAG